MKIGQYCVVNGDTDAIEVDCDTLAEAKQEAKEPQAYIVKVVAIQRPSKTEWVEK